MELALELYIKTNKLIIFNRLQKKHKFLKSCVLITSWIIPVLPNIYPDIRNSAAFYERKNFQNYNFIMGLWYRTAAGRRGVVVARYHSP